MEICPVTLPARFMTALNIGTLVAAFTLLSLHAGAEEPQPADPTLLAQLRQLEPLPKVHYSWPLPFKTVGDDVLLEYVRLSGACSLSGEWSGDDDVARAVRLCQQVNAANPKRAATIGINYSPWHRRFGKELPPTAMGPTHEAELTYLRERMDTIRAAVDSANNQQPADVQVSCVMFDSERFHTKLDDETWNAALTAKYNAVYDIVREVFPDVRIEWYGRGAVQPSASPTGWSASTLFALDEQGETFSCSLYHVPEIEITRATYRRTAALAAEHGCESVTPWIALASGYRRQTDKFHEWSLDWKYDRIYSWQLGLEVNQPWFGAAEREQRFAPWRKAEIAIFYPEPFGRTPHWGRHFVAYVRGAHHIRELPPD